jgi:hypothetical protein
MAMGVEVEVLGPPELRTRFAETSRALAARYVRTSGSAPQEAH